MRAKASFLSLSVVLTLVVFLCAALWGSYSGGDHDFQGRCEFCHLALPKDGEAGRFVRDISYLCLQCHNVSRESSHPIGMVPSMQLPEGFALDWGGKMTCATCHDPHADDSDDNLSFMRTPARGKDFCDLCHLGTLPLGGGLHVGAVGIAHTKSGIIEGRHEFDQILDEISVECLYCHDGVIASDASYRVKGGEAVSYQREGLSHPIGMDYQKAALRDSELRPVEMISADIALYDGKVGCASCHNPYSRKRRMLIMDNSRSGLCLECHIK